MKKKSIQQENIGEIFKKNKKRLKQQIIGKKFGRFIYMTKATLKMKVAFVVYKSTRNDVSC